MNIYFGEYMNDDMTCSFIFMNLMKLCTIELMQSTSINTQ